MRSQVGHAFTGRRYASFVVLKRLAQAHVTEHEIVRFVIPQ